jgi:hypothetical protein
MLVEVLRDMEFIRFQSNFERFKLQLPVCDSWAVYAGCETYNILELGKYGRSDLNGLVHGIDFKNSMKRDRILV